MDAKQQEAKYGLSSDLIERSAAQYESGDYPHCSNPVHTGSHMDAVGKKRVTVVYSAEDVQKVSRIAKSRGVKPSDVYRAAMRQFLDAQTA